ncbi:hypothetical protein WJX81_000625 [Elliptochloris bilobata]|uniref:4a-hydroxytetrahydrobiopterin dehydratase n=1 Tax=Elliptochloris bilobata TaxID=381761 RepID=A0AAW1RHU6_9CHLO
MLPQVEGWSMTEDSEQRLRLERNYRAKNFVKALQLCERFGEVAEAEQHHPDLHLTNWNRLRVELWTHARGGLTENDFIMAAKLDAVPKEDLLSKKKP